MSIAQRLRRLADWFDPQAEQIIQELPEAQEIPPGSVLISQKVNVSETPGHPEMKFSITEQIFETPQGGIIRRFIKKNLLLLGCRCHLTSSTELAFESYDSKLPVCKNCAQEYRRMREETRHENCKCRHQVAPHELTPVEGYGYLCSECLKKYKKITPVKFFKFLLKSLAIIEDNQPIEMPHENTPLPPPTGKYCAPISRTSLPWTGDPSQNRPYNEMHGSRPKRPDPHRLP